MRQLQFHRITLPTLFARHLYSLDTRFLSIYLMIIILFHFNIQALPFHSVVQCQKIAAAGHIVVYILAAQGNIIIILGRTHCFPNSNSYFLFVLSISYNIITPNLFSMAECLGNSYSTYSLCLAAKASRIYQHILRVFLWIGCSHHLEASNLIVVADYDSKNNNKYVRSWHFPLDRIFICPCIYFRRKYDSSTHSLNYNNITAKSIHIYGSQFHNTIITSSIEVDLLVLQISQRLFFIDSLYKDYWYDTNQFSLLEFFIRQHGQNIARYQKLNYQRISMNQ